MPTYMEDIYFKQETWMATPRGRMIVMMNIMDI